MKVFISWSGERSKKVAELLDSWLQWVIQAVHPWMSSKDIDRGALWFSEINDQLANTGIGIVCITRENRVKPWILFESGALAKGLSSNRVCTFLIDLVPTDLENPLAEFNHTMPTKDGLWSLVSTINSSLKEHALKEAVLAQAFDTYWPKFEESFKNIIATTPAVTSPEIRKETEVLLEVLSTVRSIEKLVRGVQGDNGDLSETMKQILMKTKFHYLSDGKSSFHDRIVMKKSDYDQMVHFLEKKLEEFGNEDVTKS